MRYEVRRFASIDSTNRYLLDEARAGAPEGLVAVADHQDAGRGRQGRVWTAPPGSSLLVSVLLRPAVAPDRLMLVTMAAGVALAEAVEHVAGFRVALKWPNDLVVGDRKLAGLLAEADVPAGAPRPAAVVVGAGCNVQWDAFPPELASTATACNLEAGRPIERDDVLSAFLDRLDARYAGLDAVPGVYRARLGTLGRRIRVELGAGAGRRTLLGVAAGVDDSGRLLVDTDGGERHELTAGDVFHLRPARPGGEAPGVTG
jgi:BirA family transcriptional regulator, biotin operon repressor / biotin---[acetyl-CoA-carboxylase] ligase